MDTSPDNVYVLYQMRPSVADKDGSSRAPFKFLCVFGEELIKLNMQLRAQNPNSFNLPTTNTVKDFGIQIANQKTQMLVEPSQN